MNRRQKLLQQQYLNNEAEVIKKLKKIYDQASTDINDKISNLTFTINNLKLEYSWLDDDDPEKAKMKSMIQSKIYQRDYQEQLKKQVDGILKRIDVAEIDTIADYLDTCYSDAFIGTIFDAHGQGIPIITPIDQEAMVRAVQLESKISKNLYTKLGEDVDLLKKRIAAEVSRGISTGMGFADVARQLKNQTKIGYNKAIRIARTEGHRIQCTATMDAMYAAKDIGADVVKQWDSTLDARTRDSHAKVDGEIRELNKPFSNGLMFPSDPNGRPEEVINCRCALLQRARWALDDGDFTKMNNFTKNLETFNSPQEYGDFKKAFFSKENKQFMKYHQTLEERYGTRHFPTLLESMTDAEYKRYSKLMEKNPIYNKRKKTKAEDTPNVDPYSFTDEQKGALEWYVSGEGQFINQYYRGLVGSDFGDLSDDEKELSDLLDEATNRTLPDDIHSLYRSVDASVIFGDIDYVDYDNLRQILQYGEDTFGKGTYAENIKERAKGVVNKTEGKTILEKGFMSTSKDYDVVEEWGGFTGAEMPMVLEFDNIPRGLMGADLKMLDVEGEEQFEVLLARNTKYKITKLYAKNGQIHAKAQFIIDK